MDNRLRETLGRREFAVTVEVVTPERVKPLEPALGPALELARALADDGRVAGLSVTDRVKSDDDHDPVSVAATLAQASGKAPIVHLSGKDRISADLARSLGRMAAAGLENVLCISGDRLKAPPVDRPVRYLDSVNAVHLARQLLPGAFVAAGVSPFKYTEEETETQYLKMAKKHAAGAEYVITQVGWDMRKLEELVRVRAARGLGQPAVANLMVLPLGAARFIHKGSVPGVAVTDDLLALVEAAAQAPDKGKGARLRRLALQTVGAERMGYAGVQLSGLTTYEDVRRTLELVAEWRASLPTLADFWRAWEADTRLPDGRPARLHPEPAYFALDAQSGACAPPAGRGAWARYWALELLDRAVFHHASPVHLLLRPLARRVRPDSAVARWLEGAERAVKEGPFGCQLCGFCRLPETLYVCPETCPKGLANGPCGGSTGNLCEFGDRECVHSVRYRIAKATGTLSRLERTLIPPVPEPRGGSPWLNHFAGRTPEVERLPDRR